LSGVISLSGFGEEADAGRGQESGKRGCLIDVPPGWELRFLGEGVDQPLRRMRELPQGAANE
jgi:hypothetical protein